MSPTIPYQYLILTAVMTSMEHSMGEVYIADSLLHYPLSSIKGYGWMDGRVGLLVDGLMQGWACMQAQYVEYSIYFKINLNITRRIENSCNQSSFLFSRLKYVWQHGLPKHQKYCPVTR